MVEMGEDGSGTDRVKGRGKEATPSQSTVSPLASTSSEESMVRRRISDSLWREPIDPQVAKYCTSFDIPPLCSLNSDICP